MKSISEQFEDPHRDRETPEDSANTIKAEDISTGPTLDISADNVSSADYNKALTAHVVPGFQPLHEIEYYIARFNAQPWTGPFSSYDEAWRWVSSRAWSTYTIAKLVKP